MAKNKKDVKTQFCIDGYLVSEVLAGIPEGVSIVGAQVRVGKSFNKYKMVVPNKLKRKGVTAMKTFPSVEVTVTFDAVAKGTITRIVKEACTILDIEAERAWFKYITLGKDGAAGKFVRCTKEIRPDETDLRKKLTVLGLVEGTGRISTLISALSAKKYECRMSEVPVRTIICSKMS